MLQQAARHNMHCNIVSQSAVQGMGHLAVQRPVQGPAYHGEWDGLACRKCEAPPVRPADDSATLGDLHRGCRSIAACFRSLTLTVWLLPQGRTPKLQKPNSSYGDTTCLSGWRSTSRSGPRTSFWCCSTLMRPPLWSTCLQQTAGGCQYA